MVRCDQSRRGGELTMIGISQNQDQTSSEHDHHSNLNVSASWQEAGWSRTISGLLWRGRTAILGRVDESRDGPATGLGRLDQID